MDMKELIVKRNMFINRIKEIYELSQLALVDPANKSNFKAHYEELARYYTEFESLHINLITHKKQKTEDLDQEEVVRRTVDEQYFSIKCTFNELCLKEDIKANVASSVALAQPGLSNPINVKLPKVTLPIFDGNFKMWPTFFDMYQSLIHNQSSLTKIEKFQYLLSFLQNEPLNIIKNIPLTNDNYDIAFATLTNRYQNKRLLATTYWHEINSLSAIKNVQQLQYLYDNFMDNIEGLKVLGFPVDSWDFILLNTMLTKLDADTVQRFELAHSNYDMPTFNHLKLFLSQQCKALQNFTQSQNNAFQNFESKGKMTCRGNSKSKDRFTHSFFTNMQGQNINDRNLNNTKCSICKASHSIYHCKVFNNKSPRDRYKLCKQNKICINCLSFSHTFQRCNSSSTCRFCHARHHSLLHFETNSTPSGGLVQGSTLQQTSLLPTMLPSAEHQHSPMIGNPGPSNSMEVSGQILTSSAQGLNPPHQLPLNTFFSLLNSNSIVLLATAIIEVIDANGNAHKLRALLDSASQATFISKKWCNKLGLSLKKFSVPIKGLGAMSTMASQGVTSISVKPVGVAQPCLKVDAIVLPQVCAEMPTAFFENPNWNHLSSLNLADPQFNVPGVIDVLLGGDIFPSILLPDKVCGQKNEPIAFNTIFGWVLMGKINIAVPNAFYSFTTLLEKQDINKNLQKFWELEEVPQANLIMSREDFLAESLFVKTHSRTRTGHFVVTLPFKEVEPLFSDSRSAAIKRFYNLERRLQQNPALSQAYSDFMQEYISLGHMSPVSSLVSKEMPQKVYYIPHHCVINPNSSTTKLRVVFDASAKTVNGVSLNDTLLTGPKLQKDINAILLNFRRHTIVFTADIKQMYRQIWVHPSHHNYQRIVWRFHPEEPLQDYILKTVTYGVSSAPFLALRCIQQLALENENKFPKACQVLNLQTFVDDLVVSTATLKEALVIKNELNELLSLGGFTLRKWSSNSAEFLSTVPSDIQQVVRSLDEDSHLKVLGLRWCPNQDLFSYHIRVVDSECTKRNILSEIARIYDPLGFLSPVTFSLKYVLQLLWAKGVSWDQIAPSDIIEKWQKYKADLPSLTSLRIPRHCFLSTYISIELHAFGDASNLGYAACLYIRITSSNSIVSNLVCAKTKVAPLKRISLPRLELCASLLVSKLVKFVIDTYNNTLFNKIFAWSDSMVCLAWIRSPSYRWKTFVANRVSQIQEVIPPENWYHVDTQHNPADCATRGMLPSNLLHTSLWWKGPEWLSLNKDMWPSSQDIVECNEALVERCKVVLVGVNDLDTISNLLNKFSSLQKILRILSYCLMFIRFKFKKKSTDLLFTESELNKTLLALVKHVQGSCFATEIENLANGKNCSKQIRRLSPFMDEQGILRVGGRLTQSQLSFEMKHPALLPTDHRLTKLIIEDFHKKYLHCGIQTLHYLIMQQFWIISGRRAIRRVISDCYKCFRVNPPLVQPKMGDLPACRVTQAKPFQCSAVDFGGPFYITLTRSRGAKSQKAYLCLFVCCSTKALHLELASDLSTQSFLAALRRFLSRRGRVSVLHSDCGTNFVGASKYLSEIFEKAVSSENIEWRFNPPSAPHFGGLWEAGIKSVKTHLLRLIGEQILSYEELYTILTQIEAVLNSRPICPLTSDPNDLNCLTPGHFLTMAPLSCLPDPDLSKLNISRLDRWQLLVHFHQQFWRRWHVEYLHTLQQRSKWLTDSSQIQPGTLVVLRDNLTPPLKWQLGRVIEAHPGKDGVVRVVSIKTVNGLIKRPVVKVSPLPSQ